jgi:hypothetical protein
VSLPSDIIQLFGTGSVPVLVGGTVLGVFELGERFASQRAKDALSKWLVTFDVRKAGQLPDGTQQLFARIFGERHFSLKCFIRSAAFSLGAMAFIGILLLLIDPKGMRSDIAETTSDTEQSLALALWLPLSIMVDYISLLKTRIILRILTRVRRATKALAIVMLTMDFVIYKLLFTILVLSVLSW